MVFRYPHHKRRTWASTRKPIRFSRYRKIKMPWSPRRCQGIRNVVQGRLYRHGFMVGFFPVGHTVHDEYLIEITLDPGLLNWFW